MEEERRQPEEMPEQKIEISEQPEKILEVGSENASARESREQLEAETLRKKIEQAFPDKKEEPSAPQKDFQEKLPPRKNKGVFKRMGSILGKSLGWVADSIRGRVDKFDIKYSGGENIRELEGKPYLLVANHIKPKNILMQAMGLSPDSFVLEKIGETEGGKKPKIITNVTGKVSRIPILGLIDKVWSPFREGVMEGMGFIPVKTKRAGKQGGFNRNFIENIRKAKENGEPIIIFPQGHWSRKFDPKLPYETGASAIAKSYGLPIMPAYIEGADSWGRGKKVFVNIGQSINPEGKTKEEITAEIESAIMSLSEKSNEQ